MRLTLLIIFALGVIAYVILGLRRRLEQTSADTHLDPSRPNKDDDKNCAGGDSCGVSCFCDDKALKRQLSEDIIYYEDEELDTMRGIAPDAYTDEQIEVFSDVLTTLQPTEIPDWLHSLQLRGINLPEALKEEAAMMME